MNENVTLKSFLLYFIRKILILFLFFLLLYSKNSNKILFWRFFLNIFSFFFFFIIIKKNFTSKLCQIDHNRNKVKTYFHGSSPRRRRHEYIQRACGMIHRASYPMKRYQLVQIFYQLFERVGRQSHPGKQNKCIDFLF